MLELCSHEETHFPLVSQELGSLFRPINGKPQKHPFLAPILHFLDAKRAFFNYSFQRERRRPRPSRNCALFKPVTIVAILQILETSFFR